MKLAEVIVRVMRKLDARGIKLKPTKCKLYTEEVVWCGRSINVNGVGVAPEFRETLAAMPHPRQRPIYSSYSPLQTGSGV